MRRSFLLLVSVLTTTALADGPIGPPVDDALLRSSRARAYEAERRSRLRAEQEARDAESARLTAIANAQRAADEKARREQLEGTWRVVQGQTNNLAHPSWRLIAGKVLETQPTGLRVYMDRDETVLLQNYGFGKADGEHVSAFAVEVGLHTYTTIAGGTATIRKYDCGEPCEAPREWVMLRNAQREAEARAAAAAREAAERKRVDNAIATQERVLRYQLIQASNGYPSFQFEVAKRYLNGEGLPQNRALAVHWLLAATTNGLIEASNLLIKVGPQVTRQ